MHSTASTGALVRQHPLPAFSFFVVASCFSLAFAPQSVAQSSAATIVAIEEDWELVAIDPDVNSTAPQVTCAFSPSGNVDSLHATFEINHQSLPAFVPGGLQLQIWNGEWAQSSRKFPNPSVMQLQGETVRWTQTMRVDEGHIVFEIINGDSSSWGSFGGQGYLRHTLPTDLTNLNQYNPDVSIDYSGIGFAANRVQSLVLKRVRTVTADGEEFQTDINGVVHQHD